MNSILCVMLSYGQQGELHVKQSVGLLLLSQAKCCMCVGRTYSRERDKPLYEQSGGRVKFAGFLDKYIQSHLQYDRILQENLNDIYK